MTAAKGSDLVPRKQYVLPASLRPELAGAFGPVVTTGQLALRLAGAKSVVAVGDMVSLTLREIGITPRLFVCDYHTMRGQDGKTYRLGLGDWGRRELRATNPAGVLTREAWLAVREGLQDQGPPPVRLVVEGEEDLLGIPCFLESPVGTRVLYGMPGQGVVVVTVDEAFKQRVRGIVSRMASV